MSQHLPQLHQTCATPTLRRWEHEVPAQHWGPDIPSRSPRAEPDSEPREQIKALLPQPQKYPWVSTDISLVQLHHRIKTTITLGNQLSSSQLNNPSQPCSTGQRCRSAKQLTPKHSLKLLLLLLLFLLHRTPPGERATRTGVAHPLFQLNTVIGRAAQGYREPN